MLLFDTHAHYDADWFDADRHEILAGLPARSIGLVVNPGCDIPTSRTAVELAERYSYVYAAVGIHPSDCAGTGEAEYEALRELARHEKVVAIGEIGLDYYWEDNPPKEFQQQVLRRQIELALEVDLPVIIHDREAHQDCLNIVKSHPNVNGVYHCYSGSIEDAKTLVKMGWMISFTGVITFKNARRSLEIIEWLPMDRIMVETDAPYLTPEPFRGKRNDSAKVRYMIETIANVKGMDPEEVARITLENGKRFFNIK